MRSFLKSKAAVLVYKSMILPILEQGDIFLVGTSAANRKKLQILQNKGLRCALNRGIETSNAELHSEAKLLKLNYRREQHMLSYMYDQSLNPALLKKRKRDGVRTRSHCKRLLRIKRPINEKFRKSVTYRGPKTWNALADSFHQAQSKAVFKSLVRSKVTLQAKAEVWSYCWCNNLIWLDNFSQAG